MRWNKKAQGLEGFLKVIVVGIIFLAFFPFLSLSLEEASNQHSGSVSWLIAAILFVIVYIFLKFAFNLGED